MFPQDVFVILISRAEPLFPESLSLYTEHHGWPGHLCVSCTDYSSSVWTQGQKHTTGQTYRQADNRRTGRLLTRRAERNVLNSFICLMLMWGRIADTYGKCGLARTHAQIRKTLDSFWVCNFFLHLALNLTSSLLWSVLRASGLSGLPVLVLSKWADVQSKARMCECVLRETGLWSL
jgi:hypothetical protein